MQTDRKAAILEAFMRLVSRFGVDKTTMQDVAKEAGISVGVIYKDFENKEELICAYIQNLVDQLLSQCKIIIEQDKPAEEILHDFVMNFFYFIGMLLTKDHGFYQFLSEDYGFRFFQNAGSYKTLIVHEMAMLIKKIMEKGIDEKAFEIDDTESSSILFFQAFNIFNLEMVFEKKSLEEVLPNIEKMYQFLIRAVLKR